MNNTVWSKSMKEGLQMRELTDNKKKTNELTENNKETSGLPEFPLDSEDNIPGTSDATKEPRKSKEKKKETSDATKPPRKTKDNNTETSDATKEPRKSKENANAMDNSSNVAYYNNLPPDGKFADETILYGISSYSETPGDTLSPPPPTDPPKKPPIIRELKNAFKVFDVRKIKNVFKDLFGSTANSFKNFDKNIEKVLGHIVGDSIKSKESKTELKTVASQVSRWIMLIPMTYLVLINWWYVMCYTTFSFDFRKLIWSPSKWAVAGPINAFEFFNYYLITFRMDSNRSFLKPETLREIWGWRPIVFTVIHILLFSSFSKLKIIKLLSTAFNGKGIVYIILLVLSFFYFFTLTAAEKWLNPIFSSGLVVAAIMIAIYVICLILMFVFIPVLCPFFLMYLIFLSYFAIFAFNWFWPPTIISIINQMFQELKEAYTEDPVDKMGRLGKVCFNNFHSIYLLVTVIVICSIHVNEIVSFRTPAVIGIAVIVNLIICGIFVPNSLSAIYEIINVFSENASESSPSIKKPAEGS